MAATAAAATPGGAGGAATATASRFAAACGALGQYVRAAEQARAQPVRPLPLMPGADVDDGAAPNDEAGPAPAPAPTQMTIVYGGQVVVADDVPADKADELLRLAAAAVTPGEGTAKPCGRREPMSAADLPVARKLSLKQFMEKRKGRLAARGEPYRRPAAGRDDLTLAL